VENVGQAGLEGEGLMAYIARVDGKTHRIGVKLTGNFIYAVNINGREYTVDCHRTEPTIYSVIIDGQHYEIDVIENDTRFQVFVKSESYEMEIEDERRRRVEISDEVAFGQGRQIVATPMPGKIIEILVKQGDAVKAGQGVIVIEAMKMENELSAPKDGTITEILVKEGQAVEARAKLLVIE
jgi:biotin carboxyl carrier protein